MSTNCFLPKGLRCDAAHKPFCCKKCEYRTMDSAEKILKPIADMPGGPQDNKCAFCTHNEVCKYQQNYKRAVKENNPCMIGCKYFKIAKAWEGL